MLSDKCRQKRQSRGYAQDGPLLAAILKAEQSLALEQFSLVNSFGHAAGVCPKEGCGLRAGSRSSRTHCCRRCEMAHLHGKRLDRDPGPGPTTGEPWKKAHGPECTGHADRKMPPPVPPRQMPSLPEFVTPVPPAPPPYAAPEAYHPAHYDNSGGYYVNSPYYDNSGGYVNSGEQFSFCTSRWRYYSTC